MKRPCSPLGGWKGGKFRLAGQIVARFPPHHCYCEPFCGAAHVFFRKARARVEILNDINADIINFFEVCRDRPLDLIARFKYAVASRKLFETYRDEPAPGDPVERAFRFVYILKLCFGGRMTGRSDFDRSVKDSASVVALDKTPEKIAGAAHRVGGLNAAPHAPESAGGDRERMAAAASESLADGIARSIDPETGDDPGSRSASLKAPEEICGQGDRERFVGVARHDGKKRSGGCGIDHAFESASAAHARLAGFCDEIHGRYKRVSLECGPWQKMLVRYDSPETLFYLDPPYEGRPCYPGENLFVAERDLPELAERLSKIRGMFALSINDGEAPRSLFAGHNFIELVGSYSSHNLKNKARVRKRELLITNYEPPQGGLLKE